MRYLFCSLTMPEFLHPLVGLALELRRRGHEVAFATGTPAEGVLHGAGLETIPPEGRADGFRHQPRPIPVVIETDVRHVEHAIREYRPDVLVASEYAFGAFMVRERTGIPLCVMDMATYMGPRRGFDPILNEIRAYFGLPSRPSVHDDFPLMADLFLLHSVAPLEADAAALPPQVTLVGACEWEPPAAPVPHPEGEGPLVFVRHRRTLHEPEFWPQLAEALDGHPARVVASVAPWDYRPDPLPSNFAVADRVERRAVLPRAALVVSGTRSTAPLWAAANGVPSVVIPGERGEGREYAARLEGAGCAVRLDPGEITPQRLRDTVDAALADAELRRRAAALQPAFAAMGGFRAAADAVQRLN